MLSSIYVSDNIGRDGGGLELLYVTCVGSEYDHLVLNRCGAD